MIYNGKHHEFIMQQMSDLRCPLYPCASVSALVPLCVVSCLIWLHLLPPVAGMRSKNEEREREGAVGRDSERGAKTEKESEWRGYRGGGGSGN